MKLVLASTSFYRKQLLNRLDLEFDTAAPNVDETPIIGEDPDAYVKRLSIEKSKSLKNQFNNALIIGSDQILITQEGHIQGKPNDHANAVRQLRQVRGKQARLVTGIALFNTHTGAQQFDAIEYKIGYRNYSDSDIEQYLQREKPYDCAGALKSEGLGTVLLSQLSGDDPTAVIGLPLIRLTQMLLAENVSIL